MIHMDYYHDNNRARVRCHGSHENEQMNERYNVLYNNIMENDIIAK